MSTKRVRDENDADIAKLVKRRKYYIIPKDQREILDKGTFYSTLKNQPDGLRSNIPPAVIEGLTAQYRRNEAAKSSNALTIPHGSQTPGPGSPARSNSEYGTPRQNAEDAIANTKDLAVPKSRASTDRSNHREGSQSTNPQNLQSPSLSSSPERPMSWEPSPTYHHYRQDTAQPTEAVEEPPSPSQTASRGVRVPSGASPRVQIDYGNIPSSDGAEDDLEVNIPDAQELFKPIINISGMRRGLLMSSPLKETSIVQNTPPCAQPDPAIVPNTLDQKPRGLDNGGQRKGRKAKWLPIPSLSDEVPHEQSEHTKVRMPTTRVFDMDSSNATESSMIVPATLEPVQGDIGRLRQEHLSTPLGVRRTLHLELSPPGSQEVAERKIERKTTTSNAQSDDHRSGSHDSRRRTPRSDIEKNTDGMQQGLDPRQFANTKSRTDLYPQEGLTQGAHQPSESALALSQLDAYESLLPGGCALRVDVDPYTHFKSIYPSYEGEHGGSPTKFIQAVAILESPLSRTSIKSMLFDDFVRQFAGGYTAYVHETGPNRESQPALEWFNWRDEPSVFTSGVLDRSNIDFIRKAYPLAFEEAKKLSAGDVLKPQISHQPSEEVRETIEVDTIDECDDSAEFELGEPDRPRHAKANGAYLAPTSGSFTVIDSKQRDRAISDEKRYVPQRLFRSPEQPRGQRTPLTDLGDTASQEKVSRQGEARTSTVAPTAQGLHGGTHDESSLADFGASERRTLNMTNSEQPAVSPAARSAASVPPAGTNSVTGSGKKTTSAFMRPPRPLSDVTKPGSRAPPSSSMASTCTVSSSAGSRKPRVSGMAYLQRLKLKGSSDEARNARMRELGRAKRMSSGGSVTSSHAS